MRRACWFLGRGSRRGDGVWAFGSLRLSNGLTMQTRSVNV